MPLLKELQDKVRAAHLLVRPADEWDRLSEKVHQAWASSDEHQLDTARKFHVLAWASVARNLLADPFEGVGITTTPAATDWGIATLSTARRSCEPQLTDPAESMGAHPRLRSFEEVMAGYNACLDRLSGTTSEPFPTRNSS